MKNSFFTPMFFEIGAVGNNPTAQFRVPHDALCKTDKE